MRSVRTVLLLLTISSVVTALPSASAGPCVENGEVRTQCTQNPPEFPNSVRPCWMETPYFHPGPDRILWVCVGDP